jgi:hypothetical protein
MPSPMRGLNRSGGFARLCTTLLRIHDPENEDLRTEKLFKAHSLMDKSRKSEFESIKGNILLRTEKHAVALRFLSSREQ